jgi:autotransporter-associated beta strand protein
VGSVLNSTWDKGATANWLLGASPSTYADPDLVHFDDTSSNSTVTVSTQVGPAALTFTNNSRNYTFNGSGAIIGAVELVKAGSGSLALSESGGDSFNLGVTVTAGTVILDGAGSSISGGATVSSGATLQIGNNDANGNLPAGDVTVDGSLVFKRTDNLAVSTAISGTGSLTQQGAGKLTLSAVNQYTGNTAVLQGTLALSVASAISNSANVNISGASLDVSALTATAILQNLSLANAGVTLVVTDSITPMSVSTLSLGGAGNTITVTSLPPIASYPTSLKLIQSGGVIGGAFNFSVSLPAGFVGTAIPSGDNTAVLLKLTSGPVGVRPSVGWVGNNNVTTTTNWSDPANWQLPGAPTASDNVIFAGTGTIGGSGAGSPFNSVGAGRDGIVFPPNINNFVDSSFSVGTLTYSNLSGSFHNTLLANGASLTVNSNGSLVVGSTTVAYGDTGFVTIAGMNSTLNVSNTNGTMFVGNGNSGGQATLDLSGLGSLNASVSRLFVGVGSGSGGIGPARESGILYLALTNNIKAVIVPGSTESSDTATNALAIDVGDDDGNAGMSCFLYLGQTNAIFGDAIGVGRQKPTGTMQFNPNLTGNNTRPAAYFRGANASRIATWSIGDQVVNSGSGESATGTCDFSGGSVDALVNNMFVGRAANNSGGSGTAKGTLTLDSGIFNVTTLSCALQPSNSVKVVNGTINVNTNSSLGTSGTIAVSGTFNLAVTAGGSGASTSTGTLNVDGGTFSARTIICGTNGASSSVSLGASGFGGILTVTNTLGSGTAPLTSLNLSGGTLQLGVNGSANVTNIIATSIGAANTTTLNIVSVVRAATGVAYPLISYAGNSDPFGNLVQGTLPAGAVGTITDDTAHSLIVITFTQVPPTPATITSISVSGTLLNLTATGANPNSQFTLQGATNLLSPVWKPILNNTFDANGNLNLNANVVNPAVPQTFYRILCQ